MCYERHECLINEDGNTSGPAATCRKFDGRRVKNVITVKVCAEIKVSACKRFDGTENIKRFDIADEIWFTDLSHKVFNIQRANSDYFWFI